MSKILIDNSSLLFLVRDLLPLDKDKQLYDFIEEKFKNENFLLLESVYGEIRRISNGICLEKLPYLESISRKRNLDPLLTEEHNIIDNNWVIKTQKDKLTNGEYSNQKDQFIKDADCQLVIYARRNKYSIITQESKSENDGKLFKKIPKICKHLSIGCSLLTEYLEKNNFIIKENLCKKNSKDTKKKL